MMALDACVNSEHGVIIRIETNRANEINTPALRAKQVIYRFRQEFGNPEYTNIQVRLSPTDPDNELWLIKTSSDLPQKVHTIDIDSLE